MEIKIGKNGEFIQGHFGAPLVDDYNMYELSVKEDAQTVRDRMALKNAKKKALRDLTKSIERRNHQIALKKKLYDQKAKKLQTIQNNLEKARIMREEQMLAHAVTQAGVDYENMSGVSGHSLTADGSKPLWDRPSRDYAYIVEADEAFGGQTLGDTNSYAKPIPSYASPTLFLPGVKTPVTMKNEMPNEMVLKAEVLPVPGATAPQGYADLREKILTGEIKVPGFTPPKPLTTFKTAVEPVMKTEEKVLQKAESKVKKAVKGSFDVYHPMLLRGLIPFKK